MHKKHEQNCHRPGIIKADYTSVCLSVGRSKAYPDPLPDASLFLPLCFRVIKFLLLIISHSPMR